MGFREALDLKKIVGQYDEFLQGDSTASINYVRPDANRQAETEFEPIPRRLYERPENVEEPLRVGEGPQVCSASLRVAQARPVLAWDPNRYYRDLNIAWPYVNATRGDLRRGYYASNGHLSVWKTYCLSQLLNREVRAEYDALPLGEQYLNDIYVQEALKAKASDEASKRTAQGAFIKAEDVLDEWGYRLDPEQTSTDLETKEDEVVDTDRFNRFADGPHQGPDGAEWGFSYYLWRTHQRDPERLSTWQTALVSELGSMDEPPTFAVGLLGREPHPYVIGEADGCWVVFLNHEAQVEPDLACSAASALREQITNRAQ